MIQKSKLVRSCLSFSNLVTTMMMKMELPLNIIVMKLEQRTDRKMANLYK